MATNFWLLSVFLRSSVQKTSHQPETEPSTAVQHGAEEQKHKVSGRDPADPDPHLVERLQDFRAECDRGTNQSDEPEVQHHPGGLDAFHPLVLDEKRSQQLFKTQTHDRLGSPPTVGIRLDGFFFFRFIATWERLYEPLP